MTQQHVSLDESALFTHELYQSYLRAGFDKRQAMQIVLTLLQQNMAATLQKQQGGQTDADP